jgi:pyrophosphatase PpaX
MIKAIIFDVDGVLLDSFEANFELFKNLMLKAGYKPPTREEYRALFHRTLRDTVQILTGLKDETEIKKICDLVEIVDGPSPIISPGVVETIKILSEKYALAIATSRIKAYAYEPPLNTLEHYFKATVAYEDTENHKPDPEPLILAAKQLGADLAECVYVGDVENDMKAARAAGM